MSTEKSNQSGARSDGFVAHGPANFAEGIRPEIQRQVEEEFSERLAKAGWLGAFSIRAQPLMPFPLDRIERATLAELAALPEQLPKKRSGMAWKFRVVDVIKMVRVVADSFLAAAPEQQRTMLDASRKLLYYIHSDVLTPAWRAEAGKRKPTALVYQLKVTFVETRPAIWRRIQVRDCTLDRLHEHIQTAMGWTNFRFFGTLTTPIGVTRPNRVRFRYG